ncbi:unnamed protein product [Amoebophrya sp. A120]|nr:unnamed protein product [Amoebophrya sp. A120]|eukprot:GSA120T00008418001.1
MTTSAKYMKMKKRLRQSAPSPEQTRNRKARSSGTTSLALAPTSTLHLTPPSRIGGDRIGEANQTDKRQQDDAQLKIATQINMCHFSEMLARSVGVVMPFIVLVAKASGEPK